MLKHYNIKAKIRPAGMDKERWVTLGFATENATGSLSGMLLTLPLPAHGWDGSILIAPADYSEKT